MEVQITANIIEEIALLAPPRKKNISVIFMGSSKESQNVINAEALFVKFSTKQNLPLSVADHAGP